MGSGIRLLMVKSESADSRREFLSTTPAELGFYFGGEI
jgi:hypothetical protein